MSSRRLILTAILLLAATMTFAAELDYVIPASASTEGALGSNWQTEVTFTNTAAREMQLSLTFHDGTGAAAVKALTLPARSSGSLGDIVANTFGRTSAIGAIAIDVVDDALVDNLVVSSRTFNVTDKGEFGQDVPAVPGSGFLTKGYSGIINAPSSVNEVRLNFGIFSRTESKVTWKLLRNDGTVVKEATREYEAGVHAQYSPGIAMLFDATPQDNDVIQADVIAGEVVIYGSAVNNESGDPTFVPSGRFREAAPITFLGLDLDENGSVDIQAHDGVLDRALVVEAGWFPSYFRVVAVDTAGKTLTFTIVDQRNDVRLVDDNGTVQWAPATQLEGTSGSITVRASNGFHTADLVIPATFK